MQPYGYSGKLYSFFKNVAAQEKFLFVQDSNSGPLPIQSFT